MRSLSLSPLTVLPCSPLDQIHAAHEAGYDSVGLRLFPSTETDVDVMADRTLQHAIENRLAATKVQIFDVEVVRVTPDMDVAAITPALQFASRLGARRLAVTSAGLDDYAADDERAVIRSLAALCDATARHGMGVMLEFMVFRGVRNLEDALRVLAGVNAPNLAINLDALHLFRSGGTADALANVDPQLLACVQLCDAPRAAPDDLPGESRGDRLYPGEGELPLADLVAALPQELPVSVEAPSRSRAHLSVSHRARESARFTRELLSCVALRRGPTCSSLTDVKQGAEACPRRFTIDCSSQL